MRGLSRLRRIGKIPGLSDSTGNLRYQTLPKNLITEQAVIDDFDAGWALNDSGGAVSLDTNDKKSGTASTVLTTTVAGASPSIYKNVAWNFSRPLSWIWLWFDDPAKLSSMALYMRNGGNYYQFSVPLASMIAGWNLVDLRKANANWSTTGSPSWSSIILCVMRIFNKAGQSAVVKFDNLVNYAQQPAALIGFDDIRASQYTYAWPYLQSKRVRASAFAVSSWVGGGGYMTWDQIKQVGSGSFGWDIGNHTKTHPHLTSLSQADQQTQFSDCAAALDAQGLTKASKYVAYPFSECDATTFAAMDAAGMVSGRGGVQYWTLMPFNNMHQVYSLDMSSKTVTQWQTAIDDCVTNGYLFGVFAHNLVESDPAAGEVLVSDFQAVINYIKTKNMPCLTISDLYALTSGPVNIPY